MATAVAGAFLDINPFDEPNVKESKDLTKELLERFDKEGALPGGEAGGKGEPLCLYDGGALHRPGGVGWEEVVRRRRASGG